MAIKSDAQRRAVARYNKENYDQIQIRLPKGEKSELFTRAQARGESVNSYIRRLIKEDNEKQSTD